MLIARVSMTASPPSHRRLKVSHAKASCASTGKCRTPGGVPSASATSTYGAPTKATGRSGLPAPSDSLQLLRGYVRPSMNRQKHDLSGLGEERRRDDKSWPATPEAGRLGHSGSRSQRGQLVRRPSLQVKSRLVKRVIFSSRIRRKLRDGS